MTMHAREGVWRCRHLFAHGEEHLKLLRRQPEKHQNFFGASRENLLRCAPRICALAPSSQPGAPLYFVACFLVFVAAYAVTIITTSVGYHRGLTHGAVTLHPLVKRFLMTWGMWLIGIDAAAWVCMHRLHHEHSDTEQDPHSPRNVSALGIFKAQLDGYDRALAGLKSGAEPYATLGKGLRLSWPNRSGLWGLPYLLHVVVGIVVGYFFGWLMGLALFAGLMSHVVQGAVINYAGHAVGGRNFDLDDNSRNNTFAAWVVLGEGYQNNHHRYPASARFSFTRGEVDMGYAVCRVGELLGLLRIERATLMPRAAALAALAAASPVVVEAPAPTAAVAPAE